MKKPFTRSKTLDEAGWLELLADGRTRIELDLQGLQGRFCPGPGWDTQLRRIEQHLVYFISEGECVALLGGKRSVVSAGGLCWVRPGTLFRFYATGRRAPVVYRFRFTAIRSGISFRPRGGHQLVAQGWPLFEPVRQLAQEADQPGKFSRWKTQDLLSLLSIGVFEARGARSGGTVFNDAQRSAILAFAGEVKPAGQSPAALARHLGFSHDYFSRIFRRSYGISPRTWLLRQRLAQAALLLRESTRRISEIAEQLGYEELYFFSRQFRQAYGVSPRRWRRMG